MFLRSWSFFAAVVLAACATMPPPVATIEYGCASAAAALKVINLNFAKLSPATRASVVKAKAITDPVCTMAAVPTLAGAAAAAFSGAVADFAAASAEAGR